MSAANHKPAGKPVRSTAPGRPKDPAKRHAILDAAKRLFPRHGYDGISMDAIAAEAGVSKLTVYSHFRDKASLFAAAVKARCEEQLPSRAFAFSAATPIRETLLDIAERFHALACSEEAIEMYRMMAARAATDTSLATVFFNAGPKRTLDALEQLLRRARRAGKVAVDDPGRAAEQFFVLVKGLAHTRALIGCACIPCGEALHVELRAAVDLFLRAYAPAPAPVVPTVASRPRRKS